MNWIRFPSRQVVLPVLLALVALPVVALADSDWNSTVNYTNGSKVVANEPVQYGEYYGRLLRLQHNGAANGRLLCTFEHFPQDFVIYRSDNDGLSWYAISTVVESHLPPPWVFEGEPHLYELPQAVGNLPAGTVMLAGSSVMNNPNGVNLEQQLEVYYSLDQGVTWKYRGTSDSCDGTHGNIWEPNLQVAANGDLVMYYSDERSEPTYNQFLGERVSTDGGLTWGAEQKVVAVPDGVQRPGMAVTQKLPNGQYVMSYEWVNPSLPNPVYIRFSSDGINWGSPTNWGTPVKTASGAFIGATPYITWIPLGGPNGTLVVNGRSLRGTSSTDREVFVNSNLGVGAWSALPAPVQWQGGEDFDGWSSGMIPTADGRGIIQIGSSNAGNNTNQMVVAREPIILAGLNYQFSNKNSGMNLGVPGDSFTHGTLLQQLLPNASDIGQTWSFTDLGNETFLIVNPFNGLALDDYNWLTADGSPMDEWDQNSLTVQQWQPVPVGDGTFKFLNVNSARVLGVIGASKASGAGIVIWDDNGSLDHNWTLKASSFTNGTGLFLTPNPVIGGSAAQGMIVLPSGTVTQATTISLTSKTSGVTVPGSVTIPVGAHQAVFKVETTAVKAATVAKVQATSGSTNWTGSLTINP